MKEYTIITKDGRRFTILATSPRLAESVFLGPNHKYTLSDIKLTYEIVSNQEKGINNVHPLP